MKIARSSSHQKQSIFNEKTVWRQVKNHEMSKCPCSTCNLLNKYYHLLSLCLSPPDAFVTIASDLIALPSHWDLYPTSGQIRWKRMRFQAIHWTRGTLVHGLHGYHDLCIFMPASPRTEANATQMHVLTTSSADKSLRLWDVLGTKFHDDNQSKWSSNEEEYWHQWCPEGCVALCFTCFSSEETRFLRSKDSKNGRHLNSDDSMMCLRCVFLICHI